MPLPIPRVSSPLAINAFSGTEPSETEKRQIKERINANLQRLYQEADEEYKQKVQYARSEEERARLREGLKLEIGKIRSLGAEEYHTQLELERQQRRWAMGQPIDDKWRDIIMREQNRIFESFKATGSNTASSSGSTQRTRSNEHPSDRQMNTVSKPAAVTESTPIRRSEASQVPETLATTSKENHKRTREDRVSFIEPWSARNSGEPEPPCHTPSHPIPDRSEGDQSSERLSWPPPSLPAVATEEAASVASPRRNPTPRATRPRLQQVDENIQLEEEAEKECDDESSIREEAETLKRWEDEIARRRKELARREEEKKTRDERRRRKEGERRRVEEEKERREQEETERRLKEENRQEQEELRRQDQESRQRQEERRRQDKDERRRQAEEEKLLQEEVHRIQANEEKKRRQEEERNREEHEAATRLQEEESEEQERTHNELTRRKWEKQRLEDETELDVQQRAYDQQREQIQKRKGKQRTDSMGASWISSSPIAFPSFSSGRRQSEPPLPGSSGSASSSMGFTPIISSATFPSTSPSSPSTSFVRTSTLAFASATSSSPKSTASGKIKVAAASARSKYEIWRPSAVTLEDEESRRKQEERERTESVIISPLSTSPAAPSSLLSSPLSFRRPSNASQHQGSPSRSAWTSSARTASATYPTTSSSSSPVASSARLHHLLTSGPKKQRAGSRMS